MDKQVFFDEYGFADNDLKQAIPLQRKQAQQQCREI